MDYLSYLPSKQHWGKVEIEDLMYHPSKWMYFTSAMAPITMINGKTYTLLFCGFDPTLDTIDCNFICNTDAVT